MNRRVLVAVAVPTALLAAATGILVWISGTPRTPEAVAAAATPPPPSRITVAVAAAPVTSNDSDPCQVTPAQRSAMPRDKPTGLITDLPLPDGATWHEGEVGLEVEARPVFGLRGAFPFFRDLGPGVRGSDVRQLQQALARLDLMSAGQVDGVFGEATTRAVVSLYRAAGHSPALTAPDALESLDAAAAAVRSAGRSGGQGPGSPVADARERLRRLALTTGARLPAGETVLLFPGTNRLSRGGAGVGRQGSASSPTILAAAVTVTCPPRLLTGYSAQSSAPDLSVSGRVRFSLVQRRERCTIDPRQTVAPTGAGAGSGSDPRVAAPGPADGTGGQEPDMDPPSGEETPSTTEALSPADEVLVRPAAGCRVVAGAAVLERTQTLGGAGDLVVPVTALWDHTTGQTTVSVATAAGVTDVRVRVVAQTDGNAVVRPLVEGELRADQQAVVGRR